MRRCALAVVPVALAAAVAAGPASALTKSQADAAALRVLRPLAVRGATVLFGLPQVVRATQSVAVASGRRQGVLPGPKLRAARRAVWVYWLDRAYGAKFEHPGEIALVDDATGAVSRPRATLWYPLVDGRRPAYLQSLKAYTAQRWHVWSNVGGRRRVAAAAPPERVPSVLLNAIPPGSFANDCLLMYGPWADRMFSEDFSGMESFAESVGIRVYYSTKTRDAPLADFPASKDVPDSDAFLRNVDYLTRLGGCKDIMLYLDGHGSRAGAVSVSGGDSAWIFPATLSIALKAHPKVTFKVKIDSCYSGRFLGDDSLMSQPNLLFLETSSGAGEPSYFMLQPALMTKPDGTPVTRAVADPGRSEFTHRNLVGMQRFAESAPEVQEAKAEGGSLLARMLARAFDLGEASDGAVLTGRTHPKLFTNFSPFGTLFVAAVPSHTHPQPNQGHSYVCEKVRGSVGGVSVTVNVTGPLGYSATDTVTLPAGNGPFEQIVSFDITALGDYHFTVTGTLGTETSAPVQQTYTVPPESTPKGPFTCPPP